jgi:hypothetical protein
VEEEDSTEIETIIEASVTATLLTMAIGHNMEALASPKRSQMVMGALSAQATGLRLIDQGHRTQGILGDHEGRTTIAD